MPKSRRNMIASEKSVEVISSRFFTASSRSRSFGGNGNGYGFGDGKDDGDANANDARETPPVPGAVKLEQRSEDDDGGRSPASPPQSSPSGERAAAEGGDGMKSNVWFSGWFGPSEDGGDDGGADDGGDDGGSKNGENNRNDANDKEDEDKDDGRNDDDKSKALESTCSVKTEMVHLGRRVASMPTAGTHYGSSVARPPPSSRAAAIALLAEGTPGRGGEREDEGGPAPAAADAGAISGDSAGASPGSIAAFEDARSSNAAPDGDVNTAASPSTASQKGEEEDGEAEDPSDMMLLSAPTMTDGPPSPPRTPSVASGAASGAESWTVTDVTTSTVTTASATKSSWNTERHPAARAAVAPGIDDVVSACGSSYYNSGSAAAAAVAPDEDVGVATEGVREDGRDAEERSVEPYRASPLIFNPFKRTGSRPSSRASHDNGSAPPSNQHADPPSGSSQSGGGSAIMSAVGSAGGSAVKSAVRSVGKSVKSSKSGKSSRTSQHPVIAKIKVRSSPLTTTSQLTEETGLLSSSRLLRKLPGMFGRREQSRPSPAVDPSYFAGATGTNRGAVAGAVAAAAAPSRAANEDDEEAEGAERGDDDEEEEPVVVAASPAANDGAQQDILPATSYAVTIGARSSSSSRPSTPQLPPVRRSGDELERDLDRRDIPDTVPSGRSSRSSTNRDSGKFPDIGCDDDEASAASSRGASSIGVSTIAAAVLSKISRKRLEVLVEEQLREEKEEQEQRRLKRQERKDVVDEEMRGGAADDTDASSSDSSEEGGSPSSSTRDREPTKNGKSQRESAGLAVAAVLFVFLIIGLAVAGSNFSKAEAPVISPSLVPNDTAIVPLTDEAKEGSRPCLADGGRSLVGDGALDERRSSSMFFVRRRVLKGGRQRGSSVVQSVPSAAKGDNGVVRRRRSLKSPPKEGHGRGTSTRCNGGTERPALDAVVDDENDNGLDRADLSMKGRDRPQEEAIRR